MYILRCSQIIFRYAKEDPLKALHLLRLDIFCKLDELIKAFSKGGQMCKVTGVQQFDFSMYKAVVWNAHKIFVTFPKHTPPTESKNTALQTAKTLLSNCLHGVTEIREVLSVIHACMYHPQLNRIRSLIQLEEATSEVFTSVAFFLSNV